MFFDLNQANLNFYNSNQVKHTNCFLRQLFNIMYWTKYSTSYLVNSWVYTTNHKRISINYFNFVLVSGTAGMSLATVIRLEFAYPGVGVLAGDSLQYLSVATAHGVIMVFYMIMPAIFGAFGNFLLPTQLGVHDVAFPRLNSAAFWFLPGGLIMLCQLVCTDRRYARMNCFNIRELQSILKNKFFTDLLNSHEHKELLSQSMIGLRFKENNNVNLDLDITSFYKFGLHNTNLNKHYSLLDTPFANRTILSFSDLYWLEVTNASLQNIVTRFLYMHSFYIVELFYILPNALYSYPVNVLSYNTTFLGVRVFFTNFNFLTVFTKKFNLFNVTQQPIKSQESLKGTTSTSFRVTTHSFNTFSESSDNLRYTRFGTAFINYDYKTGHYIGNWDKFYPYLLASFAEVAKGVRKPCWYFSDKYAELCLNNFNKFFTNFTGKSNIKLANPEDWYSFHVTPFDNITNLYFTLLKSSSYNNLRWQSFLNIDQKFQKMFLSSTTQQRILANWKQLKFSREAWRCKLLVARNQNTLYRRFSSEESLIYSIERNAKDLLPGWAMITPFSSRTRFTTIGRIDVGLMGVFLAINASIVSSANFLVTYRYLSTLNNRKMRDARSFFSESLIIASWMMVAANPMLAISILMLLSDRHWQTSFFDYSGGGDAVLFQHMFWFFGHPEVYIILIPIFGFTNTIMSFYFRKRVSARASLMYSMYTIAFLGFFVWGHHMYMVGLSHTTRMLFSTLTVMISVPAATKLMHWCVTIVNSVFVMEIPLIYTLTFAFLFVCGGVSGMCVAHTGMDVLFHDTFYVIGHFHVMFASCAMIGIFAAFYFYFPAIYGVKYSRVYAYLHYVYYILGQVITLTPMIWLGYCGMPRRVLDYPASLGGWHAISSAGHLLSVTAILFFFVMIYDSIRQGKPAIRNNFGAGRLNTRLNFYLFEINRLSFLQKKSFYSKRSYPYNSGKSQKNFLLYLNTIETTLFSYQFFSKNSLELTLRHFDK